MKHILFCLVIFVFLCGCGKTAAPETVSPTLSPSVTEEPSAVEVPSAVETETDISATPGDAEAEVILPELTLTEATPSATAAPASQPAVSATDAPVATDAPAATDTPDEPGTDVPWDTSEGGIELPMDPL